jgi:cyclase
MRLAVLLCLGAGGLIAAPGNAQAVRDFSKVEITTTRLADNFHVLEFGGQGAAIGVLTGTDGVLMVDAQFAPMAARIAAAIARLSPRPIRYVINTHAHGDHAGGDEYFGKLGATIVAREQVLARLKQSTPRLSYENTLTLYFDAQEIRLIAIPRAHTDGDTLVYLPGLDILLAGDLFRPVPWPHIDLANGGTLQGTLDALGAIIGIAGPDTKIVVGHGPIARRADAIVQRDLIIEARRRIAALVAAGKSVDEVLAAKVTTDLDPRVPEGDITVARFVREVYEDLGSARESR